MSDNIPNTLSARQAEHDPNFMLSLARGLEVLNAFTPQRQRLTISQLSQKTQISRAAVNNLLSIDLGRGSRLPAWATSMGRVLLSALPEEQLEVTLSRVTLIRYTPHTLCDLSGLRAEIARVRMQGYALADRQIEVGLCSLAVPVLSRHGQVVAALNVGVPAATVSAAALKEKALAPLRRAAMDLSLQL